MQLNIQSQFPVWDCTLSVLICSHKPCHMIQNLRLKTGSCHDTNPVVTSGTGGSLQWRHNELHCVSNHRRLHGLLTCLFSYRSKETSKLRVTGLCAGNSRVTGEFPAHKASNAENVSIWWRHHGCDNLQCHQWRQSLHRDNSRGIL